MNDIREVQINSHVPIDDLITTLVPSFDQAFEKWTSEGVRVVRYGSSQKPKRFSFHKDIPQDIHSLSQLDPRAQLFEYLGRYRQIDKRGNAVLNEKDGGKVYFTREGLVINEANAGSAKLWMTIARGLPDISELLAKGSSDNLTFIPVAPVLENAQGRPRFIDKGEKYRVFSRYTGLSGAFIIDTLNEAKKRCREMSTTSPGAKEVEDRIDSLINEMEEKSNRTLGKLDEAGLIHAGHELTTHSHWGNITVEFTKKSAYERMIQEGTINTHFDTEETHFDVAKYLTHPEEYEAVVRLIDFDLIRMRPFELPGINTPVNIEVVKQLIQSESYYERMVGLEAFSRLKTAVDDQFLVNIFRKAVEDNYVPSRLTERIAEMDMWPNEIEDDFYALLCEADEDKMRDVYLILKRKPWSAKFKAKVSEGLKTGSIKSSTILWVLPIDQEFERQNSLLENVLSDQDQVGIRRGVYWVSDLFFEQDPDNRDAELPYKDFLVTAVNSTDEKTATKAFETLTSIVRSTGDQELVTLAKKLSERFLPSWKNFRVSRNYYDFAGMQTQEAAVKFITSVDEPWVDEWIDTIIKSDPKSSLSYTLDWIKRNRQQEADA